MLEVIVCLKGKQQRYRSADLDLGFLSKEGGCDKIMEREVNRLWHDLVQDHASLLKDALEG